MSNERETGELARLARDDHEHVTRALQMAHDEIDRLRAEAAHLAAITCEAPVSAENGDKRCATVDRLRAEVSDALDILGLAGVDAPLSLADACRSRMAALAAAREREGKLREELRSLMCLAGSAMEDANRDGAGYDIDHELAAARALLAEEGKP